MALDYKIINYKQNITRNNKTYIDLLSKSYDGSLETYGNFCRVNKWYVARPDLISLAYYGDDRYGDLLCKINGISNPFELNAGMIIFVPDVEYIMSAAKNFDLSGSDIIENDEENILENKKSEFVKQVNQRRNSNELLPGDTNYVVDKSLGLVFY